MRRKCFWNSTVVGAVLLLVAVNVTRNLARAATEYSVYRSADRGRTWKQVGRGLRTDARINAFGAIHGTVLTGTDTGLYSSRDGGATWQASKGVIESSCRITCIEVVGTNAFAGTAESGLLELEAGGRNWRINSSFPAKWVRSLKGHADQLYVGTDKDGVFSTFDSGKQWRALSNGLPDHAQVFCLTHARGQVFAGLYSNGLMRWSEAKLRWEKAGKVSPWLSRVTKER